MHAQALQAYSQGITYKLKESKKYPIPTVFDMSELVERRGMAHLLYGLKLAKLGDQSKKAAVHMNKALEDLPESPIAHALIARFSFKRDEWNLGLEQASLAISLLPIEHTIFTTQLLERLEEENSDATEVPEWDLAEWEIHEYKGGCLMALSRYAEADTSFQKAYLGACGDDGNNGVDEKRLTYSRVECLSASGDRWREAVKLLDDCLGKGSAKAGQDKTLAQLSVLVRRARLYLDHNEVIKATADLSAAQNLLSNTDQLKEADAELLTGLRYDVIIGPTHAHTHTHTHTHLHTHAHIHTYTHKHTHTHTCRYKHTHAHSQTHTCTQIYTYT
jgi:tetratricopeptide (TPR) repeat protein